ncbi:HK97 family phage prohead protease [Hyphobacterium marinum]|uniref:HK97 family phage prohead protease n=1 Tax=Hyphobacterium marinum TaxID=3116574 RepID=A0ABU7M0J3_9PROT|nr:HK97 family phage prohead protease [Hyphobacterium sp. Y6023]MEE2567333.1 HK97 family phage prohead protease [Hyphobacterium sp. Y6023]
MEPDSPAPESAPVRIEGYASLFDLADLNGDVVRKGAFTASLKRSGARGVRMLFQHEAGEPVGVWDELREDARGLFVSGRILTAGPRGRATAGLVAQEAVDGLSIGFRTRRFAPRTGGGRELLEIDLWEVSIVTFPMLPQARLRLVKPAALIAA